MGSGASKSKEPVVQQVQAPEVQGSRPQSSNGECEEETREDSMKKMRKKYTIPAPCPPSTKKVQVFDVRLYKDADDRALKAPPSLMMQDFKELVDHLTEGAKDDVAKARAIFRWISAKDVQGLNMDDLPPTNSPLEYLLKIQWNMGNHAHLFYTMCRFANLPCVIINGMNKSAAYEIGREVNKQRMAAQWNAVHLDGQWRLVDVFWASTCVIGKKSTEWKLLDIDGKIVTDEDYDESEGETQHRVNEFYFLTDPDQLIYTHFPTDPQWQLMEKPITVQEFQDYVYIREMFFYLGLKIIPESHQKCIIQPQNGQATVVFELPASDAVNVNFRYMLYRKGTTDVGGAALDRFVFYERHGKTLKYSARFPITGTFKLDIFGQDVNKHDTLDLVCSYVIECDKAMDVEPLPDNPAIGWGPGAEAAVAGLVPVSHDQATIEADDDGYVEIRFKLDKDISMLQQLLSNKIDEKVLKNYTITRVEGNEAVVCVRLPKGGEYALKLFAQELGLEGEMPNVLNYLIKCNNNNTKQAPYPEVHGGTLASTHLADFFGVKAMNHTGGLIKSNDGHVSITFEADENVDLFCEVHHNDISDSMAETFVTRKRENGQISFDMSLPVSGEYSVNIFARSESDPNRVYNVHNYLVTSVTGQPNAQVLKKNGNERKLPFDDTPLQTTRGQLDVHLPPGFEDMVAELTRKNCSDPPVNSQIRFDQHSQECVVNVSVPLEGEYELTFYERKENGILRNCGARNIISNPRQYKDTAPVPSLDTGSHHESELSEDTPADPAANALVDMDELENDQHDQPDDEPEDFVDEEELRQRLEAEALAAKHQQILAKLKLAMKNKNAEELSAAIKEMEDNEVPDDKGYLSKAKKILAAQIAKKNLVNAMSNRELEPLKQAIAAAEKANYNKMIDVELQYAKRLHEQLNKIDKLRHAILNLDQKTIAEIRSYGAPPAGVHEVMSATFLLLGVSVKQLKDWKTIQALMGKTGREGLKRKVQLFKVDRLEIELAEQAKEMICEFSKEQIHDTSAGAATFYVWVSGMIEAAEVRYKEQGGDLDDIRHITGRAKSAKPKTKSGGWT